MGLFSLVSVGVISVLVVPVALTFIPSKGSVIAILDFLWRVKGSVSGFRSRTSTVLFQSLTKVLATTRGEPFICFPSSNHSSISKPGGTNVLLSCWYCFFCSKGATEITDQACV